MMLASPGVGYVCEMLLRPLRRAPMMVGGVGFQVGLDEARRKQLQAGRQAPAAPARDVVEQLKDLKALRDDGVLSPEEFRLAKRKVLDG
jgi:Short C-terminal domain